MQESRPGQTAAREPRNPPATVLLATPVGLPISPTHARVGGLLDPLARFAREQLGVTTTTCVCLDPALSR